MHRLSAPPSLQTRRSVCRSAAALLTVALGSAADASVFNFSSVYSYLGANGPGLNAGFPYSPGDTGTSSLVGWAGAQSLTNASFSNPQTVNPGNISMFRSAWDGSSVSVGFDQNTSGASSWGGAIRLTFTVTAQTVVSMSGWLMGRGWGEEDKVWLTNTTDSVDLFRMTNRVNYGAPIASPVSFASGDLTLEVGKTYQLGWLTETVADNTGLGTDQNPVAGFTAFSFGPGGGGSVPLPGAAGLAAIGLVGLSRRRRR